MRQLIKDVAIDRIMNAVAAGTSDQTSDAVDMQGYDGCLFIAFLGTLTATQVTQIKAQQSSDDAATDAYSDIEGSGVGPMDDADSNQMLVLDIFKPQKRYLKLVVDRGTANAVIDAVVAIKYRADVQPTTQPADVSASDALVQPAEGTA